MIQRMRELNERQDRLDEQQRIRQDRLTDRMHTRIQEARQEFQRETAIRRTVLGVIIVWAIAMLVWFQLYVWG